MGKKGFAEGCFSQGFFPQKKGFYLSMEAILSMVLLVSLLAFPLPQQSSYLNDLHVFKKENDLLLLWQQQGSSLNLEQMQRDFQFAFPGLSGKIVFDGIEKPVGTGKNESIASEIAFFDGLMQRHEIKLVVFKQNSN
ncbi:MAG: hypothetical protein Q8N60_02005 [Candidatus Diapherotrites archaeon]|nr:hypothetical protein [Candidatus Diapherotrites archaeon]